MRLLLISLSSLLAMACGTTQVKGPPDEACTFESHQGVCDLIVILDPRESEDPFEATSLTLRWTWKGQTPSQVNPLIKQWNLTASKAYSLANNYSDIDQARCVVAEAIAPPECLGRAKIIRIEGQTL